MANRRSINSPGVEIREIDLSTRATTPNGTSILVAGFAPQGPTSEILSITTIAEFENIYGTPTNAAERYFYYSVRQLFTGGTNATVNVARLPYGADAGEGFSSKYSALVFPVIPTTTAGASALSAQLNGSAASLSAASYYYFTKPTLIELTESDYTTIKQGGINWATTGGGTAMPTITGVNSLTGNGVGLVILNDAKTTINEKFEGYYLNLADNTNLNPSTAFDDAKDIKTITSEGAAISSYSTIPSTRLGFSVSATSTAGIDSISEVIENLPDYSIAPGSGYDDTAILSLFKLKVTPFEKNSLTLSYSLMPDSTVASFYANRTKQDPNGGQPLNNFISTVVNDASPNLTVLVNPYISNNTAWLDANGNAQKYIRVLTQSLATTVATAVSASTYEGADSLFPLGVYAQTLDTTNNKVIGSVSTKLDTILNLAENADIVNVDVIADGGLSTIAAAVATAPLSTNGVYDDTVFNGNLKTQIDNLSDTTGTYSAGTVVSAWLDVTNKFSQFAQFRRKDCVYISDPIRHIFVQGENYKTLDDKSKNFSNNIYWPLRNLYTNYNTSYSVAYGNWVKVVDGFSTKPVWVPFSGFAAAIYTSNDAVAYPWGAPAGLNRGVVTGITDIAVNPQQKQRDLLYKVSINPVVSFPNEGTVIMGQKTLLKAPSAFDRVNVRRLFLYLEKSVLNTTKYFVFEPNTTFTRSRLVNTITPVFDLARNTQGVFDYLIVCNDTNNTTELIDDNTLVVDIYIKPTRTAEFILVNFYATRTNQNFQELLQ
jgi:phage tail sheath protein FI